MKATHLRERMCMPLCFMLLATQDCEFAIVEIGKLEIANNQHVELVSSSVSSILGRSDHTLLLADMIQALRTEVP